MLSDGPCDAPKRESPLSHPFHPKQQNKSDLGTSPENSRPDNDLELYSSILTQLDYDEGYQASDEDNESQESSDPYLPQPSLFPPSRFPYTDPGGSLGAHTQIRQLRYTRTRRRYKLPIVIETRAGYSEISALPDTGSDENIISLDMVRRAGLTIVTDASETASFTLANGKMIQAIGQVVVRFSFAKTPPSTTSTMTYMFYVFSRLAVPLIIGMAVLEQTETFSKHRDRLVEEIVPSIQALRVGSIGKPKRQLACQVNHHIGYATADTGSDLDLISLEFAISKDFEIMPAFEQVEFADGSYGITCGVIEAKFTTGTPDPITGLLQPLNSVTIERDFYILDNLTSAIVVGIDTLEELDIFSHHSGSLLSTTSRTGFSDVNVIRHVGKAERGCKKIWKSFKDQFGKPIQNNKDIEDLRQLQEDILLADQRENARREQRRGYISGLVGIAQDSAQAEEEQKIKQYETARERQLSDHSKTTNELATPVVSPLSPPIPGSSPHYYPARGYPRSKEGEGFERKSEVIRHVQIHKPLEYVCPFCTDRELKYSWQHDLKLHVRVYHADKVLSQLPEGPTRGRRWRGLAS